MTIAIYVVVYLFLTLLNGQILPVISLPFLAVYVLWYNIPSLGIDMH